MKSLHFESREEWANWRIGKITGSKVKGITPGKSGTKIGVYGLIAERLIGSAALEDEEDAMARGRRLEPESVKRFGEETGKKIVWCNDDTGWESDIDPSIAISPDAIVGKNGAFETKSLSAARHIEAFLKKEIPSEYKEQEIQYFVVNEKLTTLYWAFYHPDFPKGLDFFYFEFKRKDLKEEIAEHIALEQEALKFVRDKVNELTMYSPEEIKKAEEVQNELKIRVYTDQREALDKVYKGIKERV